MTVFPEDFLERIVGIHFPTSFTFSGGTSIGHVGATPIVLGDTTVSSTVTLPENLIWKDPPGTVFTAHNAHVGMGGTPFQSLSVGYNYSPSPPLPFTITTVWHLTSVAGVLDPGIICSVHVNGGALVSASKDIVLDSGSRGPQIAVDVTAVITQHVDGSFTVSVT